MIYDTLIIGAGPAGLTASIYAARSGMSVLVLERFFAGGRISSAHMLENYPGFPDGITGIDFCDNLRVQALRFGTEIVTDQAVSLDLLAQPKVVRTAQTEYKAHSIIIALGVSSKKLDLPKENDFVGSGISYCATCDGAFFRGKNVCVLGGGDTAFEDAIYLAALAENVTIIHRKERFYASEPIVQSAKEFKNIHYMMGMIPVEILGGLDFEGLRLKNAEGKEEDFFADGCFVALGGYVPDTSIVMGQLDTDEKGYIIAGEDTLTNVSGVFVAGDIRTKRLRQVVTAAADGAVAAFTAREYVRKCKSGK